MWMLRPISWLCCKKPLDKGQRVAFVGRNKLPLPKKKFGLCLWLLRNNFYIFWISFFIPFQKILIKYWVWLYVCVYTCHSVGVGSFLVWWGFQQRNSCCQASWQVMSHWAILLDYLWVSWVTGVPLYWTPWSTSDINATEVIYGGLFGHMLSARSQNVGN